MVLSHWKLMIGTKLESSGRAANTLNKGILSPVLCLGPTYPGLDIRDASVDTSDQYAQAKVPRNFLLRKTCSRPGKGESKKTKPFGHVQ